MFKIIFIILIINLIEISYQDGFQKDLNVNIVFPPILDRRDGIATGHLRPLGWQNRAESPVKEESATLQAEEFWDIYINNSKPTVIRGLVLDSDADRWNDIYLNRAYGHLDIKVAQRKQTIKSIEDEKIQMSLKKFIQGYRVEDWYLRVIMPEEMQNEAPIPHLLNCGPYIHATSNKVSEPKEETEKDAKKSKTKLKILSTYEKDKNKFELPKIAQLVEPYVWLSAGDTSSLIHSHPVHNLHCVLDGRKDFILMPTSQFEKKFPSFNEEKNSEWRQMLDLVETYPHSSEWYSKIDVDMVNVYKYKFLHEVVWNWASLRAGDCIYIPADYLHQVRSHGRSITSSIYFNVNKLSKKFENKYDSIKKELFSYCPPNAPLFESMITVNPHFLWTYTHSERHLNNKHMELNDAKVYLTSLLKNDKLHYEKFEHFYNEITQELKKELDNFKPSIKEYIQLNATDFWNEFSHQVKRDQNYLTTEEISNLDLTRFTQFLNIVANYHDLEKSYKINKDEL